MPAPSRPTRYAVLRPKMQRTSSRKRSSSSGGGLERVPVEPLSWLYGVARKTLANQRRSATRRESLVRRLRLETRATAPEPADERLLEALQELRARDRELLMLVAWEG
jgi:RNA polymerase sigma-70 factor (ECF subfamily)